ncbi:MAG TPA: NAD-dependent epimerase/dehydratase family protein [Sedimentisphaerales bacterium]|nr:NAD-dependent epimerase/dehydratase family protein [Sedimentisphaerales bacterium]
MGVKNILVIGGNGFVGTAVTEIAIDRGDKVWFVTRGQSVPDGATAIDVDRRKAPDDFKKQIKACKTEWDLVVDITGRTQEDVEQDIGVFKDKAAHLVFLSSEMVYDPRKRCYPQKEDTDNYWDEQSGLRMRECELRLIEGDTGDMRWTIFRPTHIYGPGSHLGCLPLENRKPDILAKMRRGERLKLVGGGHFLIQPLFCRDFADLILSVIGKKKAHEQIFAAAGPELIEARTYYLTIADILGMRMRIEEYPIFKYRKDHPENIPFLCHRYYDLSKLAASGLKMPSTPLREGLAIHVASIPTPPPPDKSRPERRPRWNKT